MRTWKDRLIDLLLNFVMYGVWFFIGYMNGLQHGQPLAPRQPEKPDPSARGSAE